MVDVYWWSKARFENGSKENFGDALVPFLLNKMTKRKFRWSRPRKKKHFGVFKKKHYLMIGSIIRLANSQSIVWGSGIINSTENVRDAKFLAVRGPLTRKRLLDLGYSVPDKYGDPALLLAYFYTQEESTIKYKYGLVPHYVDYEETVKLYSNDKDILIIDLLTNDPEEVILKMLKCECVLSSSLHGIIVAHAFGIPALWTKISDKLYGDDIKFQDYFESIGINNATSIAFKKYSINELDHLFLKYNSVCLPQKENLKKLLKDLTDTFPFSKSKAFEEAIKNFK